MSLVSSTEYNSVLLSKPAKDVHVELDGVHHQNERLAGWQEGRKN